MTSWRLKTGTTNLEHERFLLPHMLQLKDQAHLDRPPNNTGPCCDPPPLIRRGKSDHQQDVRDDVSAESDTAEYKTGCGIWLFDASFEVPSLCQNGNVE